MVNRYRETSTKIMLGYLISLVLFGLVLPHYFLTFFNLPIIILVEIILATVILLSIIALIANHYFLNKVDEKMIDELANQAYQEGLPDKARLIKQVAKKILKKV